MVPCCFFPSFKPTTYGDTLGVTRLVVQTFTTRSPSHPVTILNTQSKHVSHISQSYSHTTFYTYTYCSNILLPYRHSVGVYVAWSGRLMGHPWARTATRPLSLAQACQSSSAQGRSIPPLPGHSPGRLSALFLALWKGLFFFLSPWKGKHSPATLRLTPFQTSSLTRTDGAPLSSREPLLWPCPDPSLLGH